MTNGLSRVRALFAQAQDRVFIVSAYLGATTLGRLLDSVPEPVTHTKVFARWEMQDILSGATDWRAWDVARERGVPLFACPGLHAKIYVADSKALVGSANATASGMGLGETGNLELLIPTDATQPDVSQVLAMALRSSKEALPLGADVAAHHDIDTPDTIPIWLPEVSPDQFLGAFQGQTSHTAETLRTCTALRVPKTGRGEASLRDAVRESTSFRVVKHEFDTRPVPMTVDQLRELLVQKVDIRFVDVATERLNLLAQWIGYFGANTHLGVSPHGKTSALHAGERIVSYKLRNPTQ